MASLHVKFSASTRFNNSDQDTLRDHIQRLRATGGAQHPSGIPRWARAVFIGVRGTRFWGCNGETGRICAWRPIRDTLQCSTQSCHAGILTLRIDCPAVQVRDHAA